MGDTVRAGYDKDTNSVWVEQASDYLGLLLDEDMVVFEKEISIYIGQEKKNAQKVRITPSDKLRRETLRLKGDPSYIFGRLVYFENVGSAEKGKEIWVVTTTDTLGLGEERPIRSRL